MLVGLAPAAAAGLVVEVESGEGTQETLIQNLKVLLWS